MSELKDFFGRENKNLFGFGKNKKSKKDLPDYSIISNGNLFDEDERLKQKYRDLGIDLGREREEDRPGLGKKKKGLCDGLGNLSGSVGVLFGYSIKNDNLTLQEKIYKNYNPENKNILKKTKERNFFKNYNPLVLSSKKFIKIQTSPLGINLTLGDTASITADNIGEFALPIVEYIHQTQPDYVIASDRGARLLGLAVFRLHNRLYGRFPTTDGTMRFRRFSKSNTQEVTEQHMQPLVNEMLEHKKRPTVLVLDDWVVSGRTKRMAQQTFDKLSGGRIKTKFGVLIGGGGDVSGHNRQTPGFAGVTDWRDDSNIIGVKYGKENWGSTGIKAEPVRSKKARNYRKRMYDGIDRLAETITKDGKEAVMAKS